MKFHEIHDFCSISEPGRPWPALFGHLHPPPSAPDPYMYHTCVRARPARDAVFAPPEGGGGGGVLRPALSQTLSKGEQHPNKLKFVGMLKLARGL